MILSLQELIDVVLMTLIVGIIFSGIFNRFRPHRHTHYDPLHPPKSGFDWDAVKFAAIITAPAIILHELGHKFAAMAFGINATFHAAYTFLALGLLLKIMNVGFIFFVPGYVSFQAAITPIQSAAIAFAGPFVNLILWLGAAFAIKKSLVKGKYIPIFALTAKINMFLFFFNMIPLFIFDGAKVFGGLSAHFFG